MNDKGVTSSMYRGTRRGKIRNSLWLGLISLALFLAAACSGDAPAATPVPADDHGDTIASATDITVPFSITAQVGMPGDVDMFAVEMQAGVSYGFETSLGTLQDTVLTLLDPFDQEFAFSDDYGGLASRIEFTPANSLTMYLKVQGSNNNTGRYDLNVETFTPQPVQIERVVKFPVTDDALETPGLRRVAIFKAQPGDRIALVGTGFSSMVEGNSVFFGSQQLVITSLGPRYVAFFVEGEATLEPVRLTIETDFGEDSIEFTLDAPTGG